jgi:hypothetical protein
MPGFLDQRAPTVQSEYARYIDGDILGKIVFKNCLLNLLGIPSSSITIPLGRHGDADSGGSDDATVLVGRRKLSIELKSARFNIANKKYGQTKENWAFANLLKDPKTRSKRSYDIAVAIGLRVLGLENPNYWSYFDAVLHGYTSQGIAIDASTMPHEPGYLALCSFFIIPFAQVKTNYFRVTVDALPQSPYRLFHAWGFEKDRLKALWRSATSKSVVD